MTSCRAVRIGAAAIVGYSLGAWLGGVTLAWALALTTAAGAYVWSWRTARRAEGACGVGCTPSRARRRASAAEATVSRAPGATDPVVTGRRAEVTERGAAGDADPESDRRRVAHRT